jgi:hypothetical protein
VAHVCNPCYSGGRDQEDWDLKLAQANSSGHPISKKPFKIRADGEVWDVGPVF